VLDLTAATDVTRSGKSQQAEADRLIRQRGKMQQYRTQLEVQAAEAAKRKQEVTDNFNDLRFSQQRTAYTHTTDLCGDVNIPAPYLCLQLVKTVRRRPVARDTHSVYTQMKYRL
jgi:hypothetical protein